MRNLIKNLLLVGLLVLGLPSARAYSLLGPLPGTAAFYEDPVGGEPWQTADIGYPVNTFTFTIGFPGGPIILGYIGGPHNISEEYRRVTPTLYYAYDSQYLGYFGLAGTTNADYAYALMNSVTNVSSYSAGLSEFPTESQQYNPTAEALYLTDLKSVTLHLLVEQLGLDEPERFTWTLHARTPGPSCPTTVEYLVVQRNFDVLDSPLNAVQYSPYVNGILYTYYIQENCPVAQTAITVPFSTDLTAMQYTAVAANNFDNFGGLQLGGFYNGLTADDVAGLRYLMSSNNINYESTVLSGGLLMQTNVLPPQTFGPTLPLSLLFSQSLTTDPNTLQLLYPGINFVSVSTNIVNLVTTNFSLFFTNLPGPYTNRVPLSNGVAVYPPGGTVPFTNWSPVQFSAAPIQVSTLPLTPLLTLAQTTDPATLQTIYPGLLIDQVTTNYLSVVITTNISIFYTNQSVLPTFSNSATGSPLPSYAVIGNNPTNIYFFTNQPGPTVLAYDNTQPFTTISTLDLATFSDASATNSPATMVALYPGLQIIRSTTSPAFIPVTNFISYLTNSTGAPFQGPPQAVTAVASITYQWVTNWHHQFGNVYTNHFYNKRWVTTQNIWTTNLTGAPFGSPLVVITNYASVLTNKVSGDFFIYPTNWCGFDLTLAFPKQVAFGPTNTTIFAGFNTNGATGTNNPAGGNSFGLTQNIYDAWTNYNYAVYPGICEPVLGFGTNYTTNIVNTFTYDFVNVITNHFYTNSLVSLFITNIFIIPGGAPDQLGTNIVETNFYANIPSGDFYIVPPTWCGYQITALLTNFIVPTNIVFTNGTFGNGTVTNQQFTEVEYLSYTNYIYSIRPGTCEPAVATFTNYSTNIVTEFNYYFGNVVTNHYFTNGPVITVTTNTAPVTNGLVGAVTNIVSTNITYNGVGGDFFIIPPNFCNFTILSNQLSTVVTTTNTVTATNINGIALLPGQQYVLTSYSSYTNTIFTVQPSICSNVPAPPALRRGIEHVEFVRATFDSLVGQFFAPITNYYTMVMITNSQPVTEYYRRVITTPDILMTASDLAAGSSDITVDRTIRYDTSQVLSGNRGPGVIYGPVTFTYNKVGPAFQNGPFLNTNGFISGISTITSVNQTSQVPVLQWASFDSSTNAPILYPSGESLTDLANSIVLQVSPATVPDGTNNVAYNGGAGVQFTATGGLPPFTWSAPGLSQQVPGMSFNPTTQILSGTPLAPGTFNFTIQVVDSVNRVVNLSYAIVIH